MKNSEWKKDGFYSYNDTMNNLQYIMKALGSSRSGPYISKGKYRNSSNFVTSHKYEESTPEEILWLSTCIEKGKYVSLEEVLEQQMNYQVY